MLRRTLLLTICAGFLAAVAAAGISAKDGFKATLELPPVPPATQTAMEFNCAFTIEGKIAYVECHNVDPNPDPPKDTKTGKLAEGPNRVKVTAYPDGEVVAVGRVKVSILED